MHGEKIDRASVPHNEILDSRGEMLQCPSQLEGCKCENLKKAWNNFLVGGNRVLLMLSPFGSQ